jgi:ATP-binding cassette, subfamily F, member 3
MKVLITRDLVKYHGGDLKILSGATLAVEAGEKIGLVGRNGVGKTTLLNVLSGNSEPNGGTVERVGGAKIGMTSQSLYAGAIGERSVEEEMISAFEGLIRREKELKSLETELSGNPSPDLLERYGRLQAEFDRDGGYEYRARAASALSSLGFDPADWKRPVGSFSGGEQSRIALACLLLSEPDLVLLDEPTNHLDLRGIEWLENFVKNAKSAVLVVSHDRFFLDAVAGSILELDDGKLTRYPGNYTKYVAEKKARNEQLARKAKANVERREQLERFIEKNRAKATKAKQAKSKQKLLDRMEKIEGPRNGKKNIELDLGGETSRAGRIVLEMEGVSYGYGDEPLLEDLELVIERKERVALLGPNGAGKSTIMRLATGELVGHSGTVRLGNNVVPAYQDQQLARLDGDKTVLEEAMDATGLDAPEARDLLGAFLFSGEEVFKKVSSLSGGEQNRLSLAEIVSSDANLLLLDEPTNNLDIPALEALEDALLKYQGTLLFISHDRYFLRKLATRMVEIEKGKLLNYLGGYDYYRSHRRLDARESSGRRTPRRRVRPGLDKRQNVVATRLVAVEGEIDATERRITRLEKELATSELYADGERSRKVVTEHRQLKNVLEGLYEDWGELMEEAEEAGL